MKNEISYNFPPIPSQLSEPPESPLDDNYKSTSSQESSSTKLDDLSKLGAGMELFAVKTSEHFFTSTSDT